MKSTSQASTISKHCDCSSNISAIFWQQWQQYRDYLYYCCIKWMGGNPTDAEEALSQAMLKAWEKMQKYAGKITNFKSWLTSLTHNLCVDIHRKRSRGANQVEDIEAIPEEKRLVLVEDTPEIAMETDEKRVVIRCAIDNLPPRLRQTFILHFYEELSHQEIAQQQDISYPNVCKRISEARKILREELREYFMGEDRHKSVPHFTVNLGFEINSLSEIDLGNRLKVVRSGSELEKGAKTAPQAKIGNVSN
ncbi:MAG: RNA polymerase sigma factor [Oscillatoria sp. PMC 1051.18]|nr:RNA polymerase sigma factor [Oscillatoria sp. PMC 1050.18]MEC5028538.1 RNA polymerase sigma factor [Oscillatoria sp. PMC 1051.18]